MNIEVTWIDIEECVLRQRIYDPNSVEWAEFQQKTVIEVAEMAGADCTHFAMCLTKENATLWFFLK